MSDNYKLYIYAHLSETVAWIVTITNGTLLQSSMLVSHKSMIMSESMIITKYRSPALPLKIRNDSIRMHDGYKTTGPVLQPKVINIMFNTITHI